MLTPSSLLSQDVFSDYSFEWPSRDSTPRLAVGLIDLEDSQRSPNIQYWDPEEGWCPLIPPG